MGTHLPCGSADCGIEHGGTESRASTETLWGAALRDNAPGDGAARAHGNALDLAAIASQERWDTWSCPRRRLCDRCVAPLDRLESSQEHTRSE